MKAQHPKRDSGSLKEPTISSTWEMASIVEVVERKSYNLARQEHRESR